KPSTCGPGLPEAMRSVWATTPRTIWCHQEGVHMNTHFRNFAIWVIIGLLLIALFNMFQNPSQTRRGNEISYTELLAQVDAGNVSEVTIQGNRLNGQYPTSRAPSRATHRK